jgi:DNA polymerase-3 subunit epsilon
VADLVAASASDIVRRIQDAAALPKPKLLPNIFTYKRRKLAWETERAVPLFYELDDFMLGLYDAVVDRGVALGLSPGRYYDAAQRSTDSHSQYKGHGGAASLLDRKSLEVRTAPPAAVTLNFEPLVLVGSGRSMFVLPDQLLVQQGHRYGVVPLAQLRVQLSRTRFITDEVPAGVQPVAQTWKYLNKTGGPDRRYKDNHQIPIIAVTEIDFFGPADFQFHTAFTDDTSARAFAEALTQLTRALPPAT